VIMTHTRWNQRARDANFTRPAAGGNPGRRHSVLLELSLPLINPHMAAASIDTVMVRLGSRVAVGDTIMELTVDLSDQFPHDCPPISHYRVCAAETVWLRQLSVSAGEKAAVGAVLARFTKGPDDTLEPAVSRSLRTMIVGATRQWQAW
jgi:hypothetical protein